MSETKNINYHYMQQQHKNENKFDTLPKNHDHVNLASQIKNMLSTTKLQSNTFQLPSRIIKNNDPKFNSKFIDSNQPKNNNFLTIDNTRTNNSAFPKLTINDTKSIYVDSNNTDSSFKRNIRSQSKEINVIL